MESISSTDGTGEGVERGYVKHTTKRVYLIDPLYSSDANDVVKDNETQTAALCTFNIIIIIFLSLSIPINYDGNSRAQLSGYLVAL